MTHVELRERMTTRELAEWSAYAHLEPLSDTRADYHTALICYTLASSMGAKGVKLEDFLIQWGKASTPVPEESVNAIAAINAMLGGLDLRARSQRTGDPE